MNKIKVNEKNRPTRHIELDLFRGCAIIAMIVFHFTFDLSYFGYIASDTIYRPNWIMFQKVIAGSFVFVAGVSFNLCHGSGINWIYVKKRLFLLGSAASGISVVTKFAFGVFWIKFGILHCILLCSLISLIFVNRSRFVIFGVIVALGTVVFLVQTPVDLPVAFQWLIETSTRHNSVDYSPLMPWLLFFSLGILLSKLNLRPNRSLLRMRNSVKENNVIRSLVFLGKRSLVIYLIHQPVLFISFFIYHYLT